MGEVTDRSAALTHEQHDRLRILIDQAKRRQLDAQMPQPPKRDPAKRRASYAAYYWKNRERIRARRSKKRDA